MRPPRADQSPALAPPPGNPRFPLLDSCRGLAALGVVVGHSYTGGHANLLFDAMARLGIAVQVFFALSGFLLFRPYVSALAGVGPRPRLGDFVQRRLLRIVPAYWFALTFWSLVMPDLIRGAFSADWAVFYGFAQVYSLEHVGHGLAVAWSLSVEMSFYLFLPAFAFAVERLARRVAWRRGVAASLLAAFAVGPFVLALNSPASHVPLSFLHRINFGLPGQLPYFVVGMALAAASVHQQITGRLPRPIAWLAQRPTVTWALAAACFAVSAIQTGHAPRFHVRYEWLAVYELNALFVALALIPAMFPERPYRLPQRVLAWPPLVFVGLVSYGLYLWHVPLAMALAAKTPLRDVVARGITGWPLFLAAVLAAGLLAGALSYYLVELPFLKFKRGWRTAAHETAAGAPVAALTAPRPS